VRDTRGGNGHETHAQREAGTVQNTPEDIPPQSVGAEDMLCGWRLASNRQVRIQFRVIVVHERSNNGNQDDNNGHHPADTGRITVTQPPPGVRPQAARLARRDPLLGQLL